MLPREGGKLTPRGRTEPAQPQGRVKSLIYTDLLVLAPAAVGPTGQGPRLAVGRAAVQQLTQSPSGEPAGEFWYLNQLLFLIRDLEILSAPSPWACSVTWGSQGHDPSTPGDTWLWRLHPPLTAGSALRGSPGALSLSAQPPRSSISKAQTCSTDSNHPRPAALQDAHEGARARQHGPNHAPLPTKSL